MTPSISYESAVDEAIVEVQGEIERATVNNPPFNSAHEGWAVLYEEMDELKTEVFTNPTRGCVTPADRVAAKQAHNARMRGEAMQVAAMAIRFMADLT